MLGAELSLDQYLARMNAALAALSRDEVQQLSDLIYDSWQNGRWVFVIGNGGSGTTATHIAEDLGKGLLRDEELRRDICKRLKVLSLTDNCGWLLAVGNDLGYDQVFVQQLKNYGSPGDLLIAISGSGNSPNVLNAARWANEHGLTTYGMTGFDGGQLRRLESRGLHVNLDDMGIVESIHLSIFHWVLNDVFARIHQCGRYALSESARESGGKSARQTNQ